METIITSQTITYYGFKVVDSFPHVTVKGDLLAIGSKIVFGYNSEVCKGKIPLLYVCREKTGGFICGLDLLEKDKKFWLGLDRTTESTNPEDLFVILEQKYPGFTIYPEESFEL